MTCDTTRFAPGRRPWRAALVGALCAALPACALVLANPSTAAPAPEALAAFQRGNCNLCHAVPGIDPPPREESCTGCHVWIRSTSRDPRKREAAMGIFPLWERYERTVVSYMEVPSLDAAMARLDPEWVTTWLADPHDVRPNLPEGMPRLGLSSAEIAAIGQAFAARRAPVEVTPKPSKKNVEAGRAKMVTLGCTACHGFGSALPASPGVAQAPDLAHTRNRMGPDHIVAWIENPRALSPSASMPSFGVTRDDAIALRDFLVLAEPEGRAPAAAGPPPAATTQPVTWATVDERVFGKICAHCHMDPSNPSNLERRGPGNAGGFGWPETGIHLQSRDGVAAVADRIGPALLRRRDEAARDTVRPGETPAHLTRPAKPGMPLGLPPLSDEDISLVLGWIEQGMPE